MVEFSHSFVLSGKAVGSERFPTEDIPILFARYWRRLGDLSFLLFPGISALGHLAGIFAVNLFINMYQASEP